MNHPKFPTPYELSKLAITLRGYDTKKDPLTAVRRAMRVWFLACHEIGEAEKRTLSDNLEAYLLSSSEGEHKIAMGYPSVEDEAIKVPLSHDPNQILIPFNQFDKHDKVIAYPAWEWWQKNATGEKVEIKTPEGFERAFRKFNPDPSFHPRRGVFESTLEEFRESRKKKRLKADRERKKKRRAAERQSQAENSKKKLPDIPAKIAEQEPKIEATRRTPPRK